MELHQTQLRLIKEQTATFIRDLGFLRQEVASLKTDNRDLQDTLDTTTATTNDNNNDTDIDDNNNNNSNDHSNSNVTSKNNNDSINDM